MITRGGSCVILEGGGPLICGGREGIFRCFWLPVLHCAMLLLASTRLCSCSCLSALRCALAPACRTTLCYCYCLHYLVLLLLMGGHVRAVWKPAPL